MYLSSIHSALQRACSARAIAVWSTSRTPVLRVFAAAAGVVSRLSDRKLHRIVTATTFTRTVGSLGGEQLSRVPRGYAKDHPAAEYLRRKQFVAGCEFPADFALSPRFYPELLTVFRVVSPLVAFLNRAMLQKGTAPYFP